MPTGSKRGRRTPAPTTGAAAGALRAKYDALCRKHQDLVTKSAQNARDEVGLVRLAVAAFRGTENAMALVGEGRAHIANARWLALERSGAAEWRELSRNGAARPAVRARLSELALRELSRLPPGGSRTTTFERVASDTIHELSLERLAGATRLGVAVVRDVTARVQAERELARLRAQVAEEQRLRAAAARSAGIGHDLRNALHAIGLRVDLLARDPAVAAAAGSHFDALVRLVEDAASRLRRLSAAGGAAIPEPGPVDLGAAVLEALELARPDLEHASRARPRPILARCQLSRTLPLVAGDAPELRHVLLNLLSNARDAMPEGGLIDVRARHAAGWATLEVDDQGPGLAPEALDRLFQPFFTTKGERGTGLGLANVAAYARRVGGYVSAANRLQGGARFTLTLPAWRDPDAVAASDPAAQASARGDERGRH
ncbi:MAG TPA: HAMP domain-containing sensor histidine kinase [Anaeromyxobacteraceae bacterium]|nr:HAMP domain-containing sensor histidine kinase [Anaeromyxobacteraceae bacterium]